MNIKIKSIGFEYKISDFWIGLYYKCNRNDRLPNEIIKEVDIWVCFIPCFPLHISYEIIRYA